MPIIYKSFSWRARPKAYISSNELTVSETQLVDSFIKFERNKLSIDILERYSDVVFLLSPSAFVYYLPGFMEVSVLEETVDYLICDSIIQMLDRSAQPDYWDEFFCDRWMNLTKDEYSDVRAWIEWMDGINSDTFFSESLCRSYVTVELLAGC